MQKVIHKDSGRGVAERGWLHSRFSFSFADWYDPLRMGFGVLRVINDDVVDPKSGFAMHPHNNMEIITIVTQGIITHKDSMGNKMQVRAGDVQVMSAGTGVVHSEHNDGDEKLSLYQIWIEPKEKNIEPQYSQKHFELPKRNELQLIVSGDRQDETLLINQNAYIYKAILEKGNSIPYVFKNIKNGAYVFVTSGSIMAGGEDILEKDAIGIWDTNEFGIEALEDSEFLIFDVPISV